MIQRFQRHIYREPNATTLDIGPLWLTWGQPHYMSGVEGQLRVGHHTYGIKLSVYRVPQRTYRLKVSVSRERIYDPDENDGMPF